MANDNQTQATPAVSNAFWDRVEGKTASTPSAAPPALPAQSSQSSPPSEPQADGVSHSFWDRVEGKTSSGTSQTQTGQSTQPQGDIVDRAVAGTRLESINRGLSQGVAAGFGLDPAHPEALTWSDIGQQVWNTLKHTAERSYERLGGASDEELEKSPAYRIDVPLRSAAAMVGTPFDMMASGIDGMASLFEDGGKEFISGIKSQDHESAARGFGKILSAAGQLVAGAEAPEFAEKAVGAAGKLTEYSPREVQGTKMTGASRPANIMQGPINRSVDAVTKDVRFGDPSKALVEEGITWPGTKGRLAQVNGKIGQLGSQLASKLQSAKGSVDILNELAPVIDKYREAIRLSNATPALKASMFKDLDALIDTAIEHAPSGKASISAANRIKQAIGDSVNWTKRPAGQELSDVVLDAYKDAYNIFKNKVNDAIGADGADLNRRVSNLMSAKNSLRELNLKSKVGKAPDSNIELSKPTAALKNIAGHVAPAVIVGSQKAAAAAKQAAGVTTSVGTLSEGASSQSDKWVRVKTGDNKMLEVHPQDLEELQRRDPKAEVIPEE